MAEDLPPTPEGQMEVQSKKVFSRPGDPPMFINAAEFSAMGLDVFMDVGVISPEATVAAKLIHEKAPSVPAPIDFQVSFRFGMTVAAAVLIHQRLSLLLQQHSAAQSVQSVVRVAEQEKTGQEKQG